MRWSVVVLLLLSLVPLLDGLRVVHHARLQRQRQAVLASSSDADLVSSDADASALVDVAVGVGETAGQAAARQAFCASGWGAVGLRAGAGNGYFAFSLAGGGVHYFWVPNASGACPVARVASGACGDVCIGERASYNAILVNPHIHWASYASATHRASLRLSLKNRCTNIVDFHHPAGETNRVPVGGAGVGCNVGTTGLATTYAGICTINPAHAQATAAIAAWNAMFT